MSRGLSRDEKETIINFNEAEDIADIFTYNKTWQKHLEKKLGLKPYMDNGYGGKEYKIPKRMIRPPRATKKLSDEVRRKAAETMRKNRNPNAKYQVITSVAETIN